MWHVVPVVLQGWQAENAQEESRRQEIFNVFSASLDWIPKLLSWVQIGMLSSMFDLVSEECFDVLEGCLYSIRGFKPWIRNLEHLCLHSRLRGVQWLCFLRYFPPFVLFLCGCGLEDELVEAFSTSSSYSMDSKEVIFPFFLFLQGGGLEDDLLLIRGFKRSVPSLFCLCELIIRILSLVITQISIRVLRIFWYKGQEMHGLTP